MESITLGAGHFVTVTFDPDPSVIGISEQIVGFHPTPAFRSETVNQEDNTQGDRNVCMSYPISSFLSDAVATSLCSTHPRYR